jgi:predicted nucleic acid-binding protein
MNAVDTNILIYSLDRRDLVKRAEARKLLRELTLSAMPSVLLWQVLGEFVRQLRAWQASGQLSKN